MGDTALSRRKDDHLDIVLGRRTAPATVAAGWEDIRFEHCALPELDLTQIDLSASLLGKTMRAPLLISSMTGGMPRAEAINRHLSEAAQDLGIAICVGSQRVSLQSRNSQGLTRALRRLAPDIPLLANIGAAQLREADGLELARRAVDALEADGLIVHLNPLQEAVQPEGDRDWRGVLAQIARAARSVGVPIVAKEVGSGLSASVACALVEAGVAMIDVAGAGGTSWAAVEGERARDAADRAVAMAFADWGIPTPGQRAGGTSGAANGEADRVGRDPRRRRRGQGHPPGRGHCRAGGRRAQRGYGIHRSGCRAFRDRHPPVGRRLLLHRLG